jgi:AmmeMemoRadiSam system protein B/AmmeMemoRadiSam system protein A
MQATHVSPFQGTWYPDGAAELQHLLDRKFEHSARRVGAFPFNEALAFVTPHAGPEYSGTVAAAVYRALQHVRSERVIVLAFPHRGGLRGVAVPDVEAIATPLGEVVIDAGFAAGLPRVPEEAVCDHSFEIQLPFLQKAVPGAALVPVYVGSMADSYRGSAADILANLWRPGVVFIASSDFTHYGRDFGYVPFPPDSTAPHRLRDLDFDCIDAAGSLDAQLFTETLRRHRSTVCGAEPIALLLEVIRRIGAEDVYQMTLDYQTSGEITGDYRTSVSYAALGYCRRSALELDATDREALLDASGQTLERLRTSGERRPVRAKGSAVLETRRGLFVSLHRGAELLGCIGNCSGDEPLAQAAAELTLSAALEDPRFSPAAQATGPIDIELSVLTPFKRFTSPEQFHLGRHGACLRMRHHTGLLLPQVADDYDWTREQFLSAVAHKAMLGPQGWKDPDAHLYLFEAQVFGRKG